MKTIEIDKPAGVAASYFSALMSSRKRPGVVKSLPKLTYARPNVVLDPNHIANYSKVCGFSAAHGVPITYPQMLTFPLLMEFLSSDECPWPAMGTVHLANRIAQHQTLNSDDALRVEMKTGRLLTH